MKSLLFFGVLLAAFFTPVCHASTGVANVSFAAPTTYTDTSALAAADLTSFEVECMQSAPAGTLAPCATPLVQGSAAARTIPVTLTYSASVGVHACFRVRAYAGGPAGLWSTQACKDFAALAPSAPANVTVTVTVVVSP